MNKIILTGRLTADPELKTGGNGKQFADFSIAVDRLSGGEKTADFFRCRGWGAAGENLCKYKRKGDLISVVGAIHHGPYTDRNGVKQYAVRVDTNEIEFLSSAQRNQSAGGTGGQRQADQPEQQYQYEDDLPF